MKYFKLMFMAFSFVFLLTFASSVSSIVFADYDYGEKYEYHEDEWYHEKGHKDGPYEDIGELVGWGTVIAMGAAVLILPLRRSMKQVISHLPSTKNIFISISRFFGKYHIYIGVSALALSIIHGAIMYLNEGRLKDEGIIGLGAVIAMAIAGILGTILSKNKKSISLRTTHTIFMIFALLIGIGHIFIS